MISAGNAWCPAGLLVVSTSLEVIAVEFVKTAAGKTQFFCSRSDFESARSKGCQYVANQRSGTTMCQLYFFIAGRLAEPGDAVPPDPLGFFALELETAGACRAGLPARPAVCKAPVGAQVASPQSPILRWSTSSLTRPSGSTSSPNQKSCFARTSGFANYKVSGFANYSRPVLLAPQHRDEL